VEIKFIKPTPELADKLAIRMREDDLFECLDAGYGTGFEAVHESIRRSHESWCCTVDGEVLAIFGVICDSLLSRTGTLWLLTSTLVDRKPKTFVKHARLALNAMRARWRVLSVGIGGGHARAIRFAQGAGFEFKGTTGNPITGAPFMLHIIGG
jgi:hypothetical protein